MSGDTGSLLRLEHFPNWHSHFHISYLLQVTRVDISILLCNSYIRHVFFINNTWLILYFEIFTTQYNNMIHFYYLNFRTMVAHLVRPKKLIVLNSTIQYTCRTQWNVSAHFCRKQNSTIQVSLTRSKIIFVEPKCSQLL